VKPRSSKSIARLRIATIVALAALFCLSMTSAAAARTILLGPPMEESTSFEEDFECTLPFNCSFANFALPAPDLVVAPRDGLITSWSIMGGTPSGPYEISTLSRSGATVTANAASPVEHPASGGLETFAASLPIKKGEYISLGVGTSASIDFSETAGSEIGFSELILAGESSKMPGSPGEIALNAILEPAPAITALAPDSGPMSGGTVVTISGSEFEAGSTVKFGTTPAAAFRAPGQARFRSPSPRVPEQEPRRSSSTTRHRRPLRHPPRRRNASSPTSRARS
jgi:hypothetical protein